MIKLFYTNDFIIGDCQKGRVLSRVARSLSEYVFAEYYGMGELNIVKNQYGKPYIKDGGIYFNISHCEKGCVCAVSDREVGVDIQDITEYCASVAEYVCTDEELSYLRKRNESALDFTRMWAMKESFVKYTGMGLSYDMRRVDTLKNRDIFSVFELEDAVISVTVGEKCDDIEKIIINKGWRI